MIFDGYTAVLTLSTGQTILHRPLPEADRRALSDMVRPLSNASGTALLVDVAQSRIVHPAGGTNGLSLRDCVAILQSRTEKADLANLREGLAIVKQYPHMAELTCGQCRAYWYDPLKGRVNRREGKMIRRTDEPCLCELSDECPLGHFQKPKGFNARNRMAFAHWKGCRMSSFPVDPIVARNARVIEEVLYGNPLGIGNGSGARRAGDTGDGGGGGDRSTRSRAADQRFAPV